MLFMRGKAMSGAPIISGTNQLPKPPIIAGITMKNTMMRPWAVTMTFQSWPSGVPSALSRYCTPGCLQLEPHHDREEAADQAGDDGEHEVHRADVLVVRRIDEAPPAGRVMVVTVRRASWARACRSLMVLALTLSSLSSRHAAAAIGARARPTRGEFLLGLLDPGGRTSPWTRPRRRSACRRGRRRRARSIGRR